jgi:hypothetical protein
MVPHPSRLKTIQRDWRFGNIVAIANVVGGIAVSLGKHVFNKHLNYFYFTIYFVNLLFGKISRGFVMSNIAIKKKSCT